MAITSKLIFVDCSRFWSSSKFLFNEQELMWNRDREFYLLGIFNVCNSSMSWYLLWITFSGSLRFSEMAFLNWLKRRAKCGGGFKSRKLFKFFVSVLVIVLLLPMKFSKFRLFKLPNGKSVLVQERQYHDSLEHFRHLQYIYSPYS